MDKTWEGGCLCGGVRYRLTVEPERVTDCHCIDCRRASGAPFVRWGVNRRRTIEKLSGELRTVPHADRLRLFAACCGTQVFFENAAGCEWVDVSISTLDHPESVKPKVAIWTEDKLPWVALDPAIPSFEKVGRPPDD